MCFSLFNLHVAVGVSWCCCKFALCSSCFQSTCCSSCFFVVAIVVKCDCNNIS
jgi:hypothetical protein